MNTQYELYRSRRHMTGIVTLLCLGSAGLGFLFAAPGSAWAASAFRIGIVFGALWLCFPTKTRPAAWAMFSPMRLILLAVAVHYAQRLKWYLPAILVGILLYRMLRPRQRRK